MPGWGSCFLQLWVRSPVSCPKEMRFSELQFVGLKKSQDSLAQGCSESFQGTQPPGKCASAHVHTLPTPTVTSLTRGISGLERQQVVIAPGVCVTFPELAQPFCRHDLILSPMKQAGKAHTFYGKSQHAQFLPCARCSKGAPCMVARVSPPQPREMALVALSVRHSS